MENGWTYPRTVRRMLINRSEPHPRSRNTPRGGRMTAKMIYLKPISYQSHLLLRADVCTLMMSEAVNAIFADLFELFELFGFCVGWW